MSKQFTSSDSEPSKPIIDEPVSLEKQHQLLNKNVLNENSQQKLASSNEKFNLVRVKSKLYYGDLSKCRWFLCAQRAEVSQVLATKFICCLTTDSTAESKATYEHLIVDCKLR